MSLRVYVSYAQEEWQLNNWLEEGWCTNRIRNRRNPNACIWKTQAGYAFNTKSRTPQFFFELSLLEYYPLLLDVAVCSLIIIVSLKDFFWKATTLSCNEHILSSPANFPKKATSELIRFQGFSHLNMTQIKIVQCSKKSAMISAELKIIFSHTLMQNRHIYL